MKRLIPIISAFLFIVAMSIAFYVNTTAFSSADSIGIVLSIIFDIVVILFASLSIVELTKRDDEGRGMAFFCLIFLAMEVSGLINYIYNVSSVISQIPPGYSLDPSASFSIGYNVALYIEIIPFFIVGAAVSGKVEILRKIMMTLGIASVSLVEFISYMNTITSVAELPAAFTVMELFIAFALLFAMIGTWTISYKKKSGIIEGPLNRF